MRSLLLLVVGLLVGFFAMVHWSGDQEAATPRATEDPREDEVSLDLEAPEETGGHRSVAEEVATDQAPDGLTFTGRIVTASGIAIPEVSVFLQNLGPDHGAEWRWTDDEGVFEFTVQGGSEVIWEAHAPGYLEASGQLQVRPEQKPLRIVLEEGLELSGRVRLADGRLAPGALVSSGPLGGDQTVEGDKLQTLADEQAHYRLTGFEADSEGEYLRALWWPGLATDPDAMPGPEDTIWSAGAMGPFVPGEAADLELHPLAKLLIRPVDDLGQSLVAQDIDVCAELSPHEPEYDPKHHAPLLEAGPRGLEREMLEGEHLVAWALRPGTWEVSVSADGWGESPWQEVEVGEEAEIEIILTRPTVLTGRVVDPEGRPIAGARVELHPDRPHLFERTGTDGRFEIQAPSGGRTNLVVEWKTILVVPIAPGDEADVGDVVFTDQETSKHGNLVATIRSVGEPPTSIGLRRPGGTFRFEGLPPDELRTNPGSDSSETLATWEDLSMRLGELEVRWQDGMHVLTSVQVEPGETTRVRIDPPQGRVEVCGTLTFRGEPMHQLLSFRKKGSDVSHLTHSSAEGFRTFLSPGTYHVRSRFDEDPWDELGTHEVEGGGPVTFDFELKPLTASISGRVLIDGAPARRIDLVLRSRDHTARGLARDHGEFGPIVVPPGSYVLQHYEENPNYWLSGHAAPPKRFELVPGEHLEGIELHLVPEARLRVDAVDPGGKPVFPVHDLAVRDIDSGIQIEAYRNGHRPENCWGGLPPGDYIVEVRDGMIGRAPVTLSSGETARLRITVQPAAKLELLILGAAGDKRPGLVDLRESNGWSPPRTPRDVAGEATFADLMPGHWTITCTGPEGESIVHPAQLSAGDNRITLRVPW